MQYLELKENFQSYIWVVRVRTNKTWNMFWRNWRAVNFPRSPRRSLFERGKSIVIPVKRRRWVRIQPELPGRIILKWLDTGQRTQWNWMTQYSMIKSRERSNSDWIGNWKVSYQNILHIASYEFYIYKNLVNGQIQRLVVVPS